MMMSILPQGLSETLSYSDLLQQKEKWELGYSHHNGDPSIDNGHPHQQQ